MAHPPLLRLPASPRAAADWLASLSAGQLRTDSRLVRPGDAFIAWPGAARDARAHVAGALAAGASACLVEHDGVQAWSFSDARIASYPGLKGDAGAIADLFCHAPSAALDIVATTGTNGKTSTAWWTAQALSALGRRCGFVGTLGVGAPPRAHASTPVPSLASTGFTTPDSVRLHGTLREMVDSGFQACALEASSIGIVEHRLAALRIDVALFTNLTQDHLDYHGSMDAYWAAKRALFDWPGLRAAAVNVDDAHGARLAAELSGCSLDLWTVSLDRPARLHALNLRHASEGLAFELQEGDACVPVTTRLVGRFNASNLLVVLAGLRALNVPLAEAAAVAAQLTPVPGRLQRVTGAEVEVVIDYAHTPDALEQALRALRPMAQARGGRLWCVFGCGGNRDATKRPLMGAIAAREADAVVITSDNPRDESPAAILAQILAGVSGSHSARVIEDRREAIHEAVVQARRGDVVLVAGKGHEEAQEIAGVKHPFSDEQEARAALARRDALQGVAA